MTSLARFDLPAKAKLTQGDVVMEQKRRNFMLTVICVSMAGALIGNCAYAQSIKTVRVGFAAALSGAQGHYGKDMEYASKIALDEANAKKFQIGGQTIKFELISEDDQADPKIGTAVAQRLVDSGVVAVVGHFNSGTSIPASRIYNAAGIPQVSPTATNPTLTSQGYKNVFRVINTDAQLGRYAGKYAVGGKHFKRIAIVDDRTAFGQGMAAEFEKSVLAEGGKIVGREFTTDKAVDFMGILAKFKGLQADLIFFGGQDAQAGPMARQMKQLEMSATLMGGGGFRNKSFINSAGPGANGTLSWDYGLPLAKMPGGKILIAKMKEKYNVEAEDFAPFSYDATWAIINAMVKANSTDPKTFLPALAAIDFDGVTGKIKFDSKGDMVNPPATLFEVKGSEWVPLKTMSGN